MRIISTGSNYVHAKNKNWEIVFSYNTPVFLRGLDGQGTFIAQYSVTSSRHISKCTGKSVEMWIKDGGASKCRLEFLADMVERII